MKRVLVDAGPLVAILAQDDEYHERCTAALASLPGPLFSCWPVITEAAWLLRRHGNAVERLLGTLASGLVELLPLESTEAGSLIKIMRKYRNAGIQLADAALVHLAARDGLDTIFTLDRRDFSIYRWGKNRTFHIVP
jgi:uncharacterized protein